MANVFFVSIKGAKQGQFKGETGKDLTKIPFLGFSYGVKSPHDAATGQASGKRQHKPLTIVKEWGVVSPQLFEALVTNEVLTSVIVQEMRTDKSGKEQVYMEIRLTDAFVSEIEIDPERLENQPVWTDHEIERVSFVFRKIEIENKVSKTAASDDWEQRA